MFTTISARNPIKSSAIQNLEVNPKTTQAIVKFNNGKEYLYSNVDTDGLFEVVFGDVKSFGKWVNQYCLNDSDVSSFNLAWLTNLSLIKQHIYTTMIAPTLSRYEDAISKIIESDDVADIEQFMEELTSYGITNIEQLENAYDGCYRDEATFCEDFMSDKDEPLPTWAYHAIDWELVWHQYLRHEYFTVYFDSEYYFFNNSFWS